MKSPRSIFDVSRRALIAGLAALPVLHHFGGSTASAQSISNPLPSWNDGSAKQAILDFVRTTTDEASSSYVPPGDRVAEFDQDGTLHPVYTQITYCLDHVGAVAKEKPELKDREPFKTVLSGDREAIAKLSMRDFFEIVLATSAGFVRVYSEQVYGIPPEQTAGTSQAFKYGSKMTAEEFKADVKKWLDTAKHPRWNRPYTELVYQPMLEVPPVAM